MNEITKLRYAAGMTQQELADRLGVSRQTINCAENSNCFSPMAIKICDFFGVSPFAVVDPALCLKFEPRDEKEAELLIEGIRKRYAK